MSVFSLTVKGGLGYPFSTILHNPWSADWEEKKCKQSTNWQKRIYDEGEEQPMKEQPFTSGDHFQRKLELKPSRKECGVYFLSI